MSRHSWQQSDASTATQGTVHSANGSEAPGAAAAIAQFFAGYFWFIVKNVIGWVLIMASWPVGLVFPGPGGIPLFLIGFALVTFPGKRRLTARVLRGKQLQLGARLFTGITAGASLIIPALLLLYLYNQYEQWIETTEGAWAVLIAAIMVSVAAAWLMTRLALRLGNLLLRAMPRIRRRIRPWMRRHGLHLLPPRYKRRRFIWRDPEPSPTSEEILEIDERHHRRLSRFWALMRPWLRRMLAAGIIILIFVMIFRPIVRNWEQVREPIMQTSPWRFMLAALMFALFLFAFRVLSWRTILSGLGHRLPLAPATRIWSISELARFLPGAIWQVVGRIYMVRPYGVSGAVSSTSQVLELTIFVLANVLVAVLGLIWIATRIPEESRFWLYVVAAAAPLLLMLLVPRIFYGLINQALRMIRKPPIVVKLSAAAIAALLAWGILGLFWQSLAVWVLLSPPQALGLGIEHLWLIAGAYCLAWCAGFFAVWMPGGLGVRELVFIKTMQIVLTDRGDFADEAAFLAMLAFLSILLRLWATTGELILAAAAVCCDRTRPQPLAISDRGAALKTEPQRSP